MALRVAETGPQFRGGPLRSNAADTTLPDTLKPAWTARLGGRLTQPVIADGKVLVADVDGHTIHALSEADGKPAVTVRNAFLGVYDCTITGSPGEAIFGGAHSCPTVGQGGPAIQANSTSFLEIQDSQLVGGPGGAGQAGCPVGPQGCR